MEIIDKIIAIGALALFSLPFLVIIGGAAYMVYSPKINSYNVITECDTAGTVGRHTARPAGVASGTRSTGYTSS